MLTDEERSVHTVMAYLNAPTDYTDGRTVFYTAASDGAEVKQGLKATATVNGCLGSGLVFRHDTWHEVRLGSMICATQLWRECCLYVHHNRGGCCGCDMQLCR